MIPGLKTIVLMGLMLLLYPSASFCQHGNTVCKDLKNGKFFLYPKNSKDNYEIIRNGTMQQDINKTTGDTALWEIEWVDCNYIRKFISGGNNKVNNNRVYKKHNIFTALSAITSEYYLYESFLDSYTDIHLDRDTIWFKEKNTDTRILKDNYPENPSFTDGSVGWQNYISKVIKKYTKDLVRANESGTCYVGFIIEIDGSVSNVETLTLEGTLLASISTQAIKLASKWNPAERDGKKIRTYRIQPVTFKISDE